MSEAVSNPEFKGPDRVAAEFRLRLDQYLLGMSDDVGYVPILTIDRLQRYFGDGETAQQLHKLRRLFPVLDGRTQLELSAYFSGHTSRKLDKIAFYYPTSLKKFITTAQQYAPEMNIGTAINDHGASYDEKITILTERVERSTGVSKPPSSAYKYGTVEADEYYEGIHKHVTEEEYRRLVGSMAVHVASVEYPVAPVDHVVSPIPPSLLNAKHPMLRSSESRNSDVYEA